MGGLRLAKGRCGQMAMGSVLAMRLVKSGAEAGWASRLCQGSSFDWATR
jgi:hypothetical protein